LFTGIENFSPSSLAAGTDPLCRQRNYWLRSGIFVAKLHELLELYGQVVLKDGNSEKIARKERFQRAVYDASRDSSFNDHLLLSASP
jgi:hypothetical protein